MTTRARAQADAAAGVLYPQYTSMESVLLDAAPAAAAAPKAGKTAPTPAPKRKAPADPPSAPPAAEAPATPAAAPAAPAPDAAATPATAGAGAAAATTATAPKKRRKKKKKGSATPSALPSGPGNADEAARIRAALGFGGVEAAPAGAAAEEAEEEEAEEGAETKEAAAAPEEAPAAPAAPPPTAPPATTTTPTSTFAFGFEAKGAPGGDTATATARPPIDTSAGALDAAAAAAALPSTTRLPPPPPPPHPAPPGLARRVFVGGMPFGYEEADVREYWEWCGPVASLDLMRFPDTGRFRGIAFITFATQEGYAKALECDGTLLDGVRVKVEPCKKGAAGVRGGGGSGSGRGGGPQGGRAPGGGGGGGGAEAAPKTPGYCVAYVGNIAFEAGPDEVGALFAGLPGAGVARVRLHTDRLTGASRGFAHVHFKDEAGLDAAVAAGRAGELELCGRAVKVGYAQPKAEGGGGGGGEVVTPVEG